MKTNKTSNPSPGWLIVQAQSEHCGLFRSSQQGSNKRDMRCICLTAQQVISKSKLTKQSKVCPIHRDIAISAIFCLYFSDKVVHIPWSEHPMHRTGQLIPIKVKMSEISEAAKSLRDVTYIMTTHANHEDSDAHVCISILKSVWCIYYKNKPGKLSDHMLHLTA